MVPCHDLPHEDHDLMHQVSGGPDDARHRITADAALRAHAPLPGRAAQ
jgi:hypothetical protein